MNLNTAILAIELIGLFIGVIYSIVLMKKMIKTFITVIRENNDHIDKLSKVAGGRNKIPDYVEKEALRELITGEDIYVTEEGKIRYQDIIKPTKKHVIKFFEKAFESCYNFRSRVATEEEFNRAWTFLRDKSFTDITSKMNEDGLNIMLRIEFGHNVDISINVGIMMCGEEIESRGLNESWGSVRDRVEGHFRFIDILKINTQTGKYVSYNHTEEEFLPMEKGEKKC